MENIILNIIKKKNYTYEELLEISKLENNNLYMQIINLFNNKLILKKDNKYIFLLDNYILDFIKIYKPTIKEIYKENSDIEKERIDKTINNLINDNKIYINSNNTYEAFKENEIVGTIERNSNNRSYIKDNDNSIVFISPKDLHTALKNDKVVVERTFDNKGKVTKILKRKNEKLVCEVKENNNKLVLVPFNGNVEIKLIVKNKKLLNDLIIGDRVYVTLNCECNNDNIVEVNDITKIGHFNDTMNDAIAIAISKDFDVDFSNEVMKEAEKVPTSIREIDKENRIDLTNETIFTIDSIHTKDMDDAVSIKKLHNGHFLLGVHIADVANYIKPKTKLFECACKRGTSLYLDDYVIPMLPSILSNGICSLNEGVERLTKSVLMEIDSNGNVVNYKIFDSVIKSKKKMTYEELNDMFDGKEVDESYLPFINDIKLLRELSNILTNKKTKEGNIEFESSEIKINKNIYKDNKINSFDKRESGEAEKIIENDMVMANETIANDFSKKGLPFIYRVHNNPDIKKIDNTIDIISNIGNKLIHVQKNYGPKAIQRILDEYKGTPEYTIVSNLLLRSMSKAMYSTNNIGHYALSSDNYCHFTSPIRRFPDLIVHTLINIFNNKETNEKDIERINELLSDIAIHSSYKERQADDAEKDYIKLKMAEYMQEHINEEFIGTILDIDKDKVFIKLDNNIKGILDTNGDFFKSFNVDPLKKQLKCNYNKQVANLGTQVKVVVTKVNIPQKEIYFDIKQIVKNKSIKKLELKND